MKINKLSRKFFARPTLIVAKELLGKILVRKIPSALSGQAAGIIRAIITETEAYCGPRDLASHASKGRTKRTEIMFGPPGHAYVYLIYGMYYCLNIVTEKENYPAAVLIRGACPVRSSPPQRPFGRESAGAASNGINGPGKLCRFLKIDKALNGEDTIKSRRLWIEDSKELKPRQIGRAKRIGVDYAGPYKDKLWRFFIRNKS